MNKSIDPSWLQAPGAHSAPAQRTQAPNKQIVTIRLDVDALAWFKAQGPGYQTRINQLLRDHMEAQRKANS